MQIPSVLVFLVFTTVCLADMSGVIAGELVIDRDAQTGWQVFTLRQGQTQAVFVPAAGANVMSILFQGTEYLHQPDSLSKLPGVSSGTPVLYPTPNRVRGGRFQFAGREYVFREGPGNHIHGLVNRASFDYETAQVDASFISVTASIRFDERTERGRLFPWEHTFRIKVTVRDGHVRWDYEVENDQSGRDLPFGVALHPYIKYHGSRKDTFLQVPAESLMESVRQLPTGNLLTLDGHPLDARQPVSLKSFHADDVFWGMQPEKPTRVEFRGADRSVEFRASKEFTHLVVWTPDQPYLGIENQTCSTDAHNLAAQGEQEVAHLQICPAGEKRTGWVEYQLE